VSAAAHPCRHFGASNAATACLTSSLVVMPCRRARFCRRCARLAGNLSVMVTDFATGNRAGAFSRYQREIAISLPPRQAKPARQRHGRLRHVGFFREQTPRCFQSFGLLCPRRTNHMTSAYYFLRLKSITLRCPRQPTIIRSKQKLSFAFAEPLPLPVASPLYAARRCHPPSALVPSASARCRATPTDSPYEDGQP
jgi:hypothetical protein